MGSRKRYTVPAAQSLQNRLKNTGFDVFYDHGGISQSQKIFSWFGNAFEEPKRPRQLSQIDIAVVQPATHRVLALVEIEDSRDNPKTLIGDVLAVWLGAGVSIGSRHDWRAGASI